MLTKENSIVFAILKSKPKINPNRKEPIRNSLNRKLIAESPNCECYSLKKFPLL